MATIRTPDQRLRVFISSTLQELAQERLAARDKVESLRLTPILFELGARPHPPRDLYRAYLEQSDIFVGIYWESYGWVAPGMDISGLEDELNLAHDKPKLLYVKDGGGRDPRLARLLDRVAHQHDLYPKAFTDTGQLGELLTADLASLLSSSFQRTAAESALPPRPSNLPARGDLFVGREDALSSLTELISRDGVRLVTVTGPGGVGKTRLALEVGARYAESTSSEVHHVGLGSVTRSELVIPTIAHSLGVQGSNAEPAVALVNHLRDRSLLLLLDNFEQVIEAANDIAAIVEECPAVKILITSRSKLNLRAEHEFQLAPLTVPDSTGGARTAANNEAVQLFVERAKAIDRGFRLSDENATAVAEICRRLDGLPLAIELAAARTRLLSPQAMLERLHSSLGFLTAGSRDAPERHQTLRAAIDWSVQLLEPDEKSLFVRMGVFKGGCTMDAAELVCNEQEDIDLFQCMASLIEQSLVVQDLSRGEPRYAMLATIAEYSREMLLLDAGSVAIRDAHAKFFMDLIAASHDGLRNSGQTAWLERLELDHDNLRAAMEWYLENERAEPVADAGWTLWLFWWLDSHLAEARRLMRATLDCADLSPEAKAKASACQGIMAFWQSDFGEGIPLLTSALQTFRNEGEMAGVALCQLPLAFAEAAMGDPESAGVRFKESIEHFVLAGDEWGAATAMNSLCWTSNAIDLGTAGEVYEEALARAEKLGTALDIGMALRNLGQHRTDEGRTEEAKDILARALRTLWRGYIRGGSSYTVEGIAEVAVIEGALDVATRLFSATDAVRTLTKAPMMPMFVPRNRRYLDMARDRLGSDGFDAAWESGRGLGLEAAAKIALEWADGERALPDPGWDPTSVSP